jgi:hypothetical protein
MKYTPVHPPREFNVGLGRVISLKDCARIELDPDEQVTFITDTGAEYDLARKSWGFYVTPSLNGRLEKFGLRGVLVKNRIGQYFMLLVERGREELFNEYVHVEGLRIMCWMDTTEALKELEEKINA